MSRKDHLLARIVDLEWEMFQNVESLGGREPCQDNYPAFRVNRISQAQNWSVPALESYLEDLETAKKEGRNLLSEKYARMMASTSKPEYESIKHLLPPLEEGVLPLVEKIADIVIGWGEEMAKKYPNLVQRGRPARSSEDAPDTTSLETYLRGELLTYSKKTLGLLYDTYHEQQAGNINGYEIILGYMVKQYGYGSLAEADSRMASPAQKA